jgi:hypothetical protein
MNLEKFILVELAKYFNNNGFSYKHYYEVGENGDFSYTGLESTFPSEELPIGDSIITVNNIPFYFPSKDKGVLNNLEFNEQEITILKGNYSYMHVLGCCDMDNHKEKVYFLSDDKVYEKNLNLSEWLTEKPEFGESAAVKCTKVYSVKGEVDRFNPTIWYQRVDLRNIEQSIKSIKLRNNPSMHVFSMTLERGQV